jgi:dTDP-L-rhamnose 4-epimerase
MSAMNRGSVLITGGAGFIGSHLADRLIAAGYPVRILDALLPQVHPGGKPSYLNPAAEFRHGDVRDAPSVRAALEGVDVVVHFAAAVGVGQSMYEVVHYSSVNVMGTATLLEAIVKERSRPRRLLVASSMSIYGEGLYICRACGPQSPGPRPSSQLERHDWAMRCPNCGTAMEPAPTPEAKPIIPTSVYAINKRDQEEMVLAVGRSLGIGAVALRFFNVYGDRQALSNPYTGVCAIFSSTLLNHRRPLVFEDGLQMRDFVHVSDLVSACVLAIERRDVSDAVFNIGTGRPTNLLELVSMLRQEIPGAQTIEPALVGQFRDGDVRCCYADISRAKTALGFSPTVTIEQGVKGLARWVAQQSSVDGSERALGELRQHGLVH